METAFQILAFLRPYSEIAIFWFAYYVLFVYIKDSGMVQTLAGLVLLVVLFFVAQILGLQAIQWVLSHLFQISIIGFLIIFQPEFRRGLTRIGQSPLFKIFLKEEKFVDEIISAVVAMIIVPPVSSVRANVRLSERLMIS